MNTEIEKIVAEYIKQNSIFSPSQTALLAVSGGADSIALLTILNELNVSGRINIKIHIAHINHLLRGYQSDADENFVIETADNFNLPVTTSKVDVKTFAQKNKLSIETAARNLRRTGLSEIARQNNCTTIVTAHHKNDNTETIIGNLLRGTGYTGCAGIRPKVKLQNDLTITRPLLSLTRVQIEDYLKTKNLSWQTDETNTDCKFTRNYIRSKLIPTIQKRCSAPLEDTLTALAQNCLRLCEKIDNQTRNIWPQIRTRVTNKSAELNRQLFIAQPQPIQIELIRKAVAAISLGQQNFTARTYTAIIDFAKTAGDGKLLSLPKNYSVEKSDNNLIFHSPKSHTPAQAETVDITDIKIPGKTSFGIWTIETKLIPACDADIENFKKQKDRLTEWFDADKIQLPITARLRKSGDTFLPFGHKTPKRIGKFLTASKITGKNKKNIFLITDKKNILWLAPVRAAQIAAVTKNTTTILQIEVLRASRAF